MSKFGKPGDMTVDQRLLSGAEIEMYRDLHQKIDDPSVDYSVFEEAATWMNFNILAKEAESKSRVSCMMERLDDGAHYARMENDTAEAERIQKIIGKLEGLPGLNDAQLISILVQEISLDELEEVIEVFEDLKYSNGVWLPQRDATLGKTLCKHEDFFHKLKRVTSSVRTQQAKGKGKKGSSGGALLDKEKLLEIARRRPVEHKMIIDALTGIGSDSMDPFAQSRMFVSEEFYSDVYAEDPDLALILRTIGEWYEGFDKVGLSFRERNRRMSNMYELFHAVLGPSWYHHRKPPGSIAGMPLRLWFALVADCDSARILVNVKLDREEHERAGLDDSEIRQLEKEKLKYKAEKLQSLREAEDRIREINKTLDTLRKDAAAAAEGKEAADTAADGDGEKKTAETKTGTKDAAVKDSGHKGSARNSRGKKDADAKSKYKKERKVTRLLRRMKNSLIKYRYIGTYDLEGGFSTLVMMVGFKPAIRLALGVLRKAQALSFIRAMPLRGFFFYRSKRARYDHVAARGVKGENLVDEWFGKNGSVKQSKRDQARERTLRKDVVVHARAYAKRANKKKAELNVTAP
jgi:hypothetical protein